MIRPGGRDQDRNNLKNLFGNSIWTERNVLQGGFSGELRQVIESLAAEVLRLGDLCGQLSQRVSQLEKGQRGT